MKEKLKRVLVTVSYIIICLVFVLVSVEITLRLLGYNHNRLHIIYDKHCLWRMSPGQKSVGEYGKGVTISTNSIGARNPEFPVVKPAGIKRIVCVGDSYTFGWAMDDSQTYPAYLQDLFDKASQSVSVINFGCNGHTILHEVELVKAYGLQLNPDYVLLQTSLNTDFREIDELEYNLSYMRFPGYNLIKTFINKTAIGNIMIQHWNSQKVKDILYRRKQLKKEAVDFNIVSSVYADDKSEKAFDMYVQKLDELVNLSKKNGFRLIYLVVPYFADSIDRLKIPGDYRKEGSLSAREYIKFIEKRYGEQIILIELMSSFTSNDLFLADGHLNDKGNKMAADIIYSKIKHYFQD